MYRRKITYINVVNTKNLMEKEINEIEITKKLKYIEVKFNDIHYDGNDPNINKDYWLGNIYEWENLLGRISLTKYSVVLYTLLKIIDIINKKTSPKQ